MEMTQAVRALAALAQESRLQAFRLLVQSGPEGLAAGKIAEELQIPAATLSFHLKELLNAGLVAQRRDGRSLVYSLHVEGTQALLEFLVSDCCQGQKTLCEPLLIALTCECSPPPVRPRKKQSDNDARPDR